MVFKTTLVPFAMATVFASAFLAPFLSTATATVFAFFFATLFPTTAHFTTANTTWTPFFFAVAWNWAEPVTVPVVATAANPFS